MARPLAPRWKSATRLRLRAAMKLGHFKSGWFQDIFEEGSLAEAWLNSAFPTLSLPAPFPFAGGGGWGTSTWRTQPSFGEKWGAEAGILTPSSKHADLGAPASPHLSFSAGFGFSWARLRSSPSPSLLPGTGFGGRHFHSFPSSQRFSFQSLVSASLTSLSKNRSG